jgi:hypothetical protein
MIIDIVSGKAQAFNQWHNPDSRDNFNEKNLTEPLTLAQLRALPVAA